MSSSRSTSTRRAALVAALVLGAALAVVIAVRTPWTVLPVPPGGHAPVDPTAGLSSAQLDRAEAFTALARPAGLISLALGVAVAGVLALTPLGGRIVRAVARPLGGGWVWQVLLGVVALMGIGRLVTLPLAAYAEVIRHRYGLSTRSWWLWLRDVAVSTAIDAGLTAGGLLALVWLARRAPRTWWAWAALGAAALVVVGSFLWPLVIEPAFNRFEPMADGPLRSELMALAEKSGTPVQDVLVSDASRRTTTLNAYVSGFGSTRRIVVYDTLLTSEPRREIELIVAHELGHAKRGDVLHGTLVGALGAAAGVCLLYLVMTSPRLLRRAGAESAADPRSIALLLAGATLLLQVAAPVENLVSRRIEARADMHALDLTRDPETYVRMQRSLSARNLDELSPDALEYALWNTHPTGPERIAMGRDWARLHHLTGAPPLAGPTP